MEEALSQVIKECNKGRHGTIQKACQEALDLLEDKSVSTQPHQLRAKCLGALQMALESRNSRLSSLAIGGMQLILKEERFQSCMESEEESHWLSMQMLFAVRNTASLPEDVQVEVMRLLLNMTMTSSQCMNAPVIICIAKLCFEAIITASRPTVRNFIVNTFLRMLHLFASKLDAEGGPVPPWTDENGQSSVRTAAKATFTQLLSTLTDKVVESDIEMNRLKDSAVAEFSSKGSIVDAESLSNDVVSILRYLCDRLAATSQGHGSHGSHGEPLLLEGILTIVCRLPESVTRNENFRDLVWQKLCPALIGILANPLADKTVVAPQRSMSLGGDEVGRGSGCSSTAPNVLSGSAKTIYSISVNLVRSLGRYASLRPVLESLFHRMLLYPPPVHRLDAIKAIRPLLSTTGGLLLLAGPTIQELNPRPTASNSTTSTKRKQENELRLLKLMVDSIQECCHCNDLAVTITSVDLINQLLTSVEDLVKGRGISVEQGKAIRALYKEPEVLEFSTIVPYTAIVEKDHDSDDSSDDSEVEVSMVVADSENGLDTAERLCAKAFVERLAAFMPDLLTASDVEKADQIIQEFSSKFCADVIASEREEDLNGEASKAETIVLSADAVYVTSYAVLHLSYGLFQSGYYDSAEPSLPVSEHQFINDIIDTGLLLIVSRGWLSAVFHLIIARNILQTTGTDGGTPSDLEAVTSPVLVHLFKDIEGLSSKKVGGQLLSEFQNQSEPKMADVFGRGANDENREPVSDEEIIEAGMLFARKVLSVCWDAILDVLSVLTSGRSSCGISGSLALLFNAKEESRRAREAICVSLEGLQRAAGLSSILGLQDRCGAVFAQLATASCVVELEDIKRERQQHHQHQHQQPDRKTGGLASVLAAAGAGSSVATKPKLARLHAAHALSMDIILSIGLELGSHTADCWQHVFRCCTHISELEHTYFSHGNDKMAAMLPRRQAKDAIPLDLATEDDLETGELYSTLAVSAEPVAPTINVRELIRQSSAEAGWDSTIAGGGVLSASQAAKVLCGLSQEVDRLYEDAANKLNMRSLVSFLSELCRSSHQQMATVGRSSGGASAAPIVTNALLLFRLGDVLSRCVRSNRPLLHIMRMWNAVSQHLIEAACHRDRTISQKAIACIHEVVTTLLSSRNEPPHFHFNEALCKPFENLLCLELCDGDAQDQIVCSLCELVEACTGNIKSGWKPIFGALRSVKIQYTTIEEVNEARLRHVAAVLDVFNVFLRTDNVLVFANAAVDCILCLLKYVRGPGEFEAKDDDDSDSDFDDSFGGNQDLCLPALQYLRQCADFLATMWLMPNCPVFVGANRIHTDHCHPIELFITSVDIAKFRKQFLKGVLERNQSEESKADVTGNQTTINSIAEPKEKLQTTDNQRRRESQGSQHDSLTGKESSTQNELKGEAVTGSYPSKEFALTGNLSKENYIPESQTKEDSLPKNENKDDAVVDNQNKEDFLLGNQNQDDSFVENQKNDESLPGNQNNDESLPGNQNNDDSLPEVQSNDDSLPENQNRSLSLPENQDMVDSLPGNQNNDDSLVGNQNNDDSLVGNQNNDNSLQGSQNNDDDSLLGNKNNDDSLPENQIKDDSLTENQVKTDSLVENRNEEDSQTDIPIKKESLTEKQNKDDELADEQQCKQDCLGKQSIPDSEHSMEQNVGDDLVSETDALLKETPTLESELASKSTPADSQPAEELKSEISSGRKTTSQVVTEEPTSNVSGEKPIILNKNLQRSDDADSTVYGSHLGNHPKLERLKGMEAPIEQMVIELKGKVTASLDELDNQSGVLHVFFLIFEGLASAVSSCPKNYQPQTLEALFQLMRSSANVPGPRFALYCVNMLLLPTLQSWLRRGTMVTGYWDTVTVANCKHYTGLCVDLVVEFIIQFTSQLELQADVELLLHQQLMVLVEFITEPVESLSRIGCSCIRHCLLHCGPVLSEAMWQIAGAALRLAFDVTLFPLRQLMTPFHENSDNFYGDVGQVKVAIRVDSTPAECERLRQLSQQVFLLDSQRSSAGQSSKMDPDDQKSFIFLIYSPECASYDPTQATRVPFRNLVLGLLSHQLLVQTVGTLLLHGTSNMVPSEVAMMAGTSSGGWSRTNSIIPVEEDAGGPRNLLHDTPLPGMLPYLSCRNLFGLLDCLSDSFRVAFQFDSRPGLKFLVQKVLRTDVAANLYKQAGVSMTLYEHVLLEIASRHDNLCAKHITNVLRDRLLVSEEKAIVGTPEQQLRFVANGDRQVTDDVALETEHQVVSNGDWNTMETKHQLAANDNVVAMETKHQLLSNDHRVVMDTKHQESPAPMETQHQRALTELRLSTDRVRPQASHFVCMLRDVFAEACSRYIDIYVDREGPNVADRLSQSLLVFLLAEPEELPSLKRDKSLKEMVAEKLRKQSIGPPGTEEESDSKRKASKESIMAEGDPPLEMLQPRRHRPSIEDRVYTVASERTVKSLVAQYRRRKQAQSMPRTAPVARAPEGTKGPQLAGGTAAPSEEQERNGKARDEMERQIEEQQKSSIMKDGEAHLRSLIEMLCSVLQLLDQLPDDQFHALQPIFFQCIARLTANCKDSQLRHSLGQWTLRIGRLFDISGPED